MNTYKASDLVVSVNAILSSKLDPLVTIRSKKNGYSIWEGRVPCSEIPALKGAALADFVNEKVKDRLPHTWSYTFTEPLLKCPVVLTVEPGEGVLNVHAIHSTKKGDRTCLEYVEFDSFVTGNNNAPEEAMLAALISGNPGDDDVREYLRTMVTRNKKFATYSPSQVKAFLKDASKYEQKNPGVNLCARLQKPKDTLILGYILFKLDELLEQVGGDDRTQVFSLKEFSNALIPHHLTYQDEYMVFSEPGLIQHICAVSAEDYGVTVQTLDDKSIAPMFSWRKGKLPANTFYIAFSPTLEAEMAETFEEVLNAVVGEDY